MERALTAAFAALDASAGVSPDDDMQLAVAKAKGLLFGYHQRWKDEPFETLSVEEEIRLPIINPETGRASRTFGHMVKIDGCARYDGGPVVNVEHKTTTEDISTPDSPYFRRLDIDAQVSKYVLAKWQQGIQITTTVYDIIRKPGIKPRNLTKAEIKAAVEVGTYCGFVISEETRAGIADGSIDRETPELYQARLADETIQNPDKYFRRYPIHRLDSEVLDYAQELWDIAQEIHNASRTGRHFRNSGACMQYNSPCEYLGICSGHDTPESDRWRKVENVHRELSIETESGGRDQLTHSRIKCFQTCRRKHYYRYELGIERIDAEEREALTFGTLIHTALEAWWNTFKKENQTNGHDDPNNVNANERANDETGGATVAEVVSV